MIPYDGLYFFYVVFILLIPAIILGLKSKPLKKYGLFVTIIVLAFLFVTNRKELILLILFYLGQLFLVKVYELIRRKYPQRWLMWVTVFLSLMPLIISKSMNLFIHKQIGFLGISYLTFKVIQIILETFDGLIKEIKIVDFTYFLLFFPTISSGPIDRSRRFNSDINKLLSKEEYKVYLREGIWKVTKGVIYKFIIGMVIYSYWLNKIPEAHTLFNTINYMYAYSFYLFFDFAGYSSMAVGISYILGVATPENFNMPFISKDIKDFWNRWHMTLSFWFRDYLYTRFVMTALKKKWFKSRNTASYIGFMITMITMGLWHGTTKYYILYGIYHGVLIVATDLFQRKVKWYKKASKSEFWNVVFTLITFNLVCFGFLIFSGYLFK